MNFNGLTSIESAIKILATNFHILRTNTEKMYMKCDKYYNTLSTKENF